MDVVWEGGKAIDTGLVRFGPDRVERDCSIAAVVIDIRDFTPFAQLNTARTVQGVLGDVEQVVQERFARSWKCELFIKGTGDGALVVSEPEWVSGDLVTRIRDASADVIRGCRALPWYGKKPANLTVGIGIDHGGAKRVTLWGRPDYISPCINRAAKMQAFARDQIAISRDVSRILGIGVVFNRDELHDIEYALVPVD
jgi:class 3 adenylate cyclase